MRARRCIAVVLAGAAVVAAAACSVETTTEGQTSQEESGLEAAPEHLLHDRNAASRALRQIEEQVGASPASLRQVLVYPEFLDVEAQDPALPEHIDEYTWRDGEVEPPEPVALTGPQEDVDASLFPSTAVQWRALSDIVAEVEARARRAKPLRIEEAQASYVIVERSTSSEDDGRVEIVIYLNGPRRSGRAELTASGDIIDLTVN